MNRLIEGVSIALAAVCLVILALWLTLYQTPVGYLHCASVVILITASLAGWRLALPAAVVACLWQLLVVPNALWLALLPLAELAWLAAFGALGMRPVRSGIILALLSLPLHLFLLQSQTASGVSLALGVAITGTDLAGFVLADLALLLGVRRLQEPVSQRTLLSAVLLDFALLPMLLLGVTGTLRQLDQRREAVSHLIDDARAAAHAVEAELHQYTGKIRLLADQLALLAPGSVDRNRVLDRLRNASPELVSAITANRQGIIDAASFYPDPERNREFLAAAHSVADRAYFREAMAGELHISAVFRGRGFGTDAIVAIAAPIIGPDGDAQGIIEGSLDLESALATLERLAGDWVLSDASGTVIRASSALGLKALEPSPPFQQVHTDRLPTSIQPLLGALYPVAGGRWQLNKLISRQDLEGPLLGYVGRWLLLAPLLFLLALIISAALARELARPLRALADRMRAFGDGHGQTPSGTTAPTNAGTIESSELIALNEGYERLAALASEYQRRLANEVGGLQKRNSRLAARLAEADALLSDRTRLAGEATQEASSRLRLLADTAERLERLSQAGSTGQPADWLRSDIAAMGARLRDMLALERQSLNPHYVQMELEQVLREAVGRARRMGASDIAVACSSSALEPVWLDSRRLGHLLDDVLSSLCAQPGRVEIQAACRDGQAIVTAARLSAGELPTYRPSSFVDDLLQPLCGTLQVKAGDDRLVVRVAVPLQPGSGPLELSVGLLVPPDDAGRLLDRQLVSLGCRATRYSSGEQLGEHMSAHQVLLIDLDMPGAEALVQQAAKADLRTIGVGATPAAGVDCLLQQPVALDALQRALSATAQELVSRA